LLLTGGIAICFVTQRAFLTICALTQAEDFPHADFAGSPARFGVDLSFSPQIMSYLSEQFLLVAAYSLARFATLYAIAPIKG
jgi:hypothetical protein